MAAARIVQVANFVMPTSGGIRTTIAALRAGYRSVGHETVLVMPGTSDSVAETPLGRVVSVGAPRLPRSGGYRMITDLAQVQRVLGHLAPDRLEVHDRFTLRALGGWARRRGVRATVVVHERLDALLDARLPWLLRSRNAVRHSNRRLAEAFEQVVCPSDWCAAEFRDAGIPAVTVCGWGVDLATFTPQRSSAVLRRRLAAGAEVLLVTAGRLSAEKRPEQPILVLRALRARGVDARLVVAGAGPLERRLRRLARHDPVTFLGHVSGRAHVAETLAVADVVICPGPLETFGLAALEALACGTPVVAARSGAAPELLAPAYGAVAWPHGPSFATGVMRLLELGSAARSAARAAAEQHCWSATIDRMLAVHALEPRRASLGATPGGG